VKGKQLHTTVKHWRPGCWLGKRNWVDQSTTLHPTFIEIIKKPHTKSDNFNQSYSCWILTNSYRLTSWGRGGGYIYVNKTSLSFYLFNQPPDLTCPIMLAIGIHFNISYSQRGTRFDSQSLFPDEICISPLSRHLPFLTYNILFHLFVLTECYGLQYLINISDFSCGDVKL